MPAREILMLVKESSYGVPMEDPVLGTDAFYIRLSESNSFSVQAVPVTGDIAYGGGLTTPACFYSDTVACTGQLQTVMYAGAYSKFMADWAFTNVNTGRTTPWTTTDADSLMPVGDLVSVSAYHMIQRNNSTYDRRRYGGLKVASGTIAQASRQDPVAKLSFQLQGIRDDLNAALEVAYPDADEFPFPAETDYPCNPYLFSHTATKLKIASARTQYDSVSIQFTNTMAPKWFETKYMNLIKFCGRKASLNANLYMKATPDDLASLKALTALDTELSFDNGTNSLKFDFNTKNIFNTLGRDLPINSTFSWNAVIGNYFDASTGADIVVSAT